MQVFSEQDIYTNNNKHKRYHQRSVSRQTAPSDEVDKGIWRHGEARDQEYTLGYRTRMYMAQLLVEYHSFYWPSLENKRDFMFVL